MSIPWDLTSFGDTESHLKMALWGLGTNMSLFKENNDELATKALCDTVAHERIWNCLCIVDAMYGKL